MTVVRSDAPADDPRVGPLVYRPQEDTAALVDAVISSGRVAGSVAADLCTGSGAVAFELARAGARSVTAVDASPDAVAVTSCRARALRLRVTAVLAGIEQVRGSFDLVTCNPPYVPTPPPHLDPASGLGPSHAWNAGIDGRDVLDPLCRTVHRLLRRGGTFFLVHSAMADPDKSLSALRSTGLRASVISTLDIPYGPVLTSRAEWLEETGYAAPGSRTERLVVIRADRDNSETRR